MSSRGSYVNLMSCVMSADVALIAFVHDVHYNHNEAPAVQKPHRRRSRAYTHATYISCLYKSPRVVSMLETCMHGLLGVSLSERALNMRSLSSVFRH